MGSLYHFTRCYHPSIHFCKDRIIKGCWCQLGPLCFPTCDRTFYKWPPPDQPDSQQSVTKPSADGTVPWFIFLPHNTINMASIAAAAILNRGICYCWNSGWWISIRIPCQFHHYIMANTGGLARSIWWRLIDGGPVTVPLWSDADTMNATDRLTDSNATHQHLRTLSMD